MNAAELKSVAVELIRKLNTLEPSAERARYKFNMIRIAERIAAGMEPPEDAVQQVAEAAEWLGAQGVP